MNYNYHTHTKRCGHAAGEAEDYVLRAIRCKIKYMGFSEHFPYICNDGFEAGFRMPVSEVEAYFNELSFLREKYKEQIEIKIGFEMEYYPENFKDMLKKAISYGGEYLILGPHFLWEEHPDRMYVYNDGDSPEMLKCYADCVSEGIRTKKFTYVAHPDLIRFTGSEELYIKEMRKICVASRECNVPLEINFLGIRDKRSYPNPLFWKTAGEEKSPVTFGFDAHNAESAYDGASMAVAERMVKEYKLNYIGKPEIIKIGG